MSEILLREILGEIKNIKSDISEMKNDVAGLKNDVYGLKQDVNVLKTDVSVLKNDVSVLKGDVSTLKNEVFGIKTTFGEHTQLLKAIEHRTEENKNTAQINAIAENIEYLKGTQARQEKILERIALRSIEQEAEPDLVEKGEINSPNFPSTSNSAKKCRGSTTRGARFLRLLGNKA